MNKIAHAEGDSQAAVALANKWVELKRQGGKIADALNASDSATHRKAAKRMKDCRDLVGFAPTVNVQTGEKKMKVAATFACKHRFCPTCNDRRASRFFAAGCENVPKLTEGKKGRWLFLTLTWKNPDTRNLRESILEGSTAWKRLSQLQVFKHNVLGFIRSTEVTQSGRTPHPHFHALLFVRPGYFKTPHYLSKERWAELWAECLRVDYKPVIDVRAVKNDDNFRVVSYVLKYGVKGEKKPLADMPPQLIRDWSDQLKGLRFFATGGIFKDLSKFDEVEEDDDMSIKKQLARARENHSMVNVRYRRKDQIYALHA